MDTNTDELSQLISKGMSGNPDMKIENPDGLMQMEPPKENKPEGELKPEGQDKPEVQPDSSLNKSGSPEKPEIPSKSFEDLVSERSQGKFKSWDEIEQAINKPEFKFADERLEKVNEYAKSGGRLEDWFSTQMIDFKNMSPKELLSFKLKQENPAKSDEEIKLELEVKYGFDKWKDKVEEYEEGVEPNSVKLSKMQYEREWKEAQKYLTEYQKKWAIPQKNEPTAEQLRAAEDAKAQAQEKWGKSVDEAIVTIDKLPVKVGDKQSFDFAVTADDQKVVNKMLKELGNDVFAPFREFQNPKTGEFDMKALGTFLIKAKYFDKAVAAGYEQGSAAGSSSVAKDVKNTSFQTEGKPDPRAGQLSVGDKVAQSILQNL